MEPLTTWRPQTTDGEGEMSASTGEVLQTQALVTLTEQTTTVTLNIEASLFTPLPKTTWVEDDSK